MDTGRVQAVRPPDTSDIPHPEIPPEAAYGERSRRFERLCDVETERWNRIANLRLFAFLAAAVALVWGLTQGITALWVLGVALLALFFGLVRYHNSVGRERQRHEELWKINVEAGSRVARDWDALPLRHAERTDPDHPYAQDLDIYGHASLMHLLESVSTHMGEAALAGWLREPARVEDVRERQAAAAELAPQVDFRQELVLRGRLMGEPRPDPAPFLAWAEGERQLARYPWLTWAAWLDIGLLWTLALAQALGLVNYPFWMALVLVNIAFTLTAIRTVYVSFNQATAGERGFQHYADSFELLAGAPFGAPLLQRIQAELQTGGALRYASPGTGTPYAHEHMRRLHRLTTLILPVSSMLYLVIQAFTLWDVHLLAAFERWKAVAGVHARGWLHALGEAEAVAALAALAHDNPRWTFPELDLEADVLRAEDLGHPLLPEEGRVNNDVEVGPPGTFLLVTGSNMSGKSTLLRAIGVNIVLAQAGGPVCASSLRLPPVSLWTAMRVEDSLERGVSYFMAELQRFKQITDAAKATEAGERRLFYLLDEILQGTNNVERQIAARRVVMYLVRQGALGAVSTHDLSLADAEEVATAARPVHFTESIRDAGEGPEMWFDYKLRPGIATSTNALRLMEMVGLELADERPTLPGTS